MQTPFQNSFLIRYLSIIYHDSESGSKQIRAKETVNTFAGIRKNYAIPSLRRDTFSAKEPGFESALASGNAYYHNCRAVRFKENAVLHDKLLNNRNLSFLIINQNRVL